jgi:hypothetical protein
VRSCERSTAFDQNTPRHVHDPEIDLLASITDRLDTELVKGEALDLCQELFLGDGARSDEEDAVLQNLKKLLE